MISQTDDPDLPMEFESKPTVFVHNPGPLSINFVSDGKDVGKLKFLDDGKVEFEGNTEASAAVFFEHVIALNSQHIAELNERIEDLEREKRDMIDELNDRHRPPGDRGWDK